MYGVGVSIETEPKGGQESGNKTRQTPRSLFKQTCPEFSNVCRGDQNRLLPCYLNR